MRGFFLFVSSGKEGSSLKSAKVTNILGRSPVGFPTFNRLACLAPAIEY